MINWEIKRSLFHQSLFGAFSLYNLYRNTGFRSGRTVWLSYIRGFTVRRFDGLSPGLVLVCLSVQYSRYSFPEKSDFNTMSPHFKSRCSFPPRNPKCKQLLNQSALTSALGESTPISFCSKRMFISSGVRLEASWGLLPFPVRLSCFCFDLSTCLVLSKSCPVITDSLYRRFLRTVHRSYESSKSCRLIIIAVLLSHC